MNDSFQPIDDLAARLVQKVAETRPKLHPLEVDVVRPRRLHLSEPDAPKPSPSRALKLALIVGRARLRVRSVRKGMV